MPRTYRILMFGLAGWLLTCLLAGMLLPAGLSWGFHFLRFVTPVEVAAAAAIIIAAAFVLQSAPLDLLNKMASFYASHPVLFAGILLGAFGIAAEIFRVRVPLLGDSFYIVKHYADVNRGEKVLDPRNEPLAAFLYYSLMRFTGEPGYRELLNTFFYAGIILGGGFIAMASVLVRNIFVDPMHRLLTLFLLLSMPYMVLFFGYLENYALVLFILMLFILTATLVLKGKFPFTLLALLAVLHMLVHYLTFLLLPSIGYVTMLLYRQGRRKEIALGAGIMVIALVALLTSIHWDFSIIFPNDPHHHYLTLTAPIALADATSQPYTVFSRYHFLDLFNYAVLMAGAVSVLFLVPFLDHPRPILPFPRHMTTFLLIAFAPITAFIVLAKFDLGAARDWDVCAAYFLFFTLAAAVFLFGRGASPAAQRVAILCIVLMLVQSIAMFRVTASTDASISRYRSLLDRRNMSQYGLYSARLFLALYYHQAGNDTSVIGLWRDYINEYPGDARGYRNILENLERVPTSDKSLSTVYERWIESIPYDEVARTNYVNFLIASGNACFRSSQLPAALAKYRRAYSIDSSNFDVVMNIGSVLAEAGRPADAIPYFQKAIQLNPDFATAYFNLANACIAIGRKDQGYESLRTAAKMGSREAADMLAAKR